MSGKTIQISKENLQAVLSEFEALRYDVLSVEATSDEDSGLVYSKGRMAGAVDQSFSLLHTTKKEMNELVNGSYEFFSGVLEATKQKDQALANAAKTSLT